MALDVIKFSDPELKSHLEVVNLYLFRDRRKPAQVIFGFLQKIGRLDSQSKFQMFTLFTGRHIGSFLRRHSSGAICKGGMVNRGTLNRGTLNRGTLNRGIGESEKNKESGNRGKWGNRRIGETENWGTANRRTGNKKSRTRN